MEISVIETVNKFLEKNVTHIITSRLDNDDAIHINYVNKIQSFFNYQNFCIVDIINGYLLRIEPKKELAILMGDHNNAFISLIEAADSIKTIHLKKHKEWASEKSRINIEDKLWLQIIHNLNISNTIRERCIYTNRYEILQHFSITDKSILLNRESSLFIIIKNFIKKIIKLIKIIKKIRN